MCCIEGEELAVNIDAVAQLLRVDWIPIHIGGGQGEREFGVSALITFIIPFVCGGVGRNGRNSMEHLALRVELNCNK